MGSVIECFFLEPDVVAQESLRRYVSSAAPPARPCPNGYHNAETLLGTVALPSSESNGSGADDFDHDDPRWPSRCSCGYEFGPSDEWQHNITRLYVRRDTGEQHLLSEAPPGAMWFADWWPHVETSPDGRMLVVMTPGGAWNVDSPSRDGSGWTRTGTPPAVTARPSILCTSERAGAGRVTYHGFLTDGRLEEC